MALMLPNKRKKGGVVVDDEDPLSVVDSQPTNLHEMQEFDQFEVGGCAGSSSAVPIQLTPAGIRTILNRAHRPKPLLNLVCSGCKRSTHSPDTYIPSDFLEWAPGYYKLSKKMKDMGITTPQPSGKFCRDCDATAKRGYPGEKREVILARLESDPRAFDEFQGCRITYVEDTMEKIKMGNPRMKKRARTIKQTNEVVLTNKMKGRMMELSAYKQEFGSPSKNGHRVTKGINPETNQSCDCVFVPKQKKGTWDCEFQIHNKVTSDQVVDNDLDALRSGQVEGSFQSRAQSMVDTVSAATTADALCLSAVEEKARIAKAAAANQLQMDVDDGTTPAPLKRRATADADMEAEDIDEETELLYAQAVAMADNEQEMAVDEAEDDEDENVGNLGGDHGETFSVAPEPKRAGRGCRSEAPSPRGGAKSSVGRGRGPSKAKSFAPVMPKEHGAIPGSGAAPVALPSPGQASPATSRPSLHDGWEKLVSVDELDLKASACTLLTAPKSLKDSKKWSVEIAKMLPFLTDLQSLLSSSSQVTNQHIKSSLTSFKNKCNDKIDKRVGYDTGKNDALSKRCTAIRQIMESCKDLRALCLALKNGRPDLSKVAEHVFAIEDSWKSLKKELWVPLPVHWVQAWVSNHINAEIKEFQALDGLSEGLGDSLNSLVFLKAEIGETIPSKKDYKFGTMADFFYFCSKGSLLDDKVAALQAKWVGEVLAKFFSGAAKHWQTAEIGLQEFLPKDMIVEDAVLCRELVPPVQLLQASRS